MPLDLGITGASVPPLATRVAKPGWRDPRLWVGVLLLTASVVAGARLLAAADDTVAVWALAEQRGAGASLAEGDLVATRVRFAHGDDLARYFRAADPLPSGVILTRGVGAGELLARSAVGSAEEAGLLQVPLQVDPHRVPPDVGAGSVVDVWITDGAGGRDPDGGANRTAPEALGPALSEVTVVAAPQLDDTFAVTGARQLVVVVDDERAAELERLLGLLQDPVIRILQRS